VLCVGSLDLHPCSLFAGLQGACFHLALDASIFRMYSIQCFRTSPAAQQCGSRQQCQSKQQCQFVDRCEVCCCGDEMK
jgi:hypothetical protein